MLNEHAYIPAEVFLAKEARLSLEVNQSFSRELDPDILQHKAYEHVLSAVSLLPPEVTQQGFDSSSLPTDFQWVLVSILRSFPPHKILALSREELAQLILGIINRIDIQELSKSMLSGPGLISLGQAVGGFAQALTPVERMLRDLMSNIARSLVAPAASLFEQSISMSLVNGVPYTWRVELANSCRSLGTKKVAIDRYWSQVRGRVISSTSSSPSLIPGGRAVLLAPPVSVPAYPSAFSS